MASDAGQRRVHGVGTGTFRDSGSDGLSCDVLVIGGGIAACAAAIEAARSGACTILASEGQLCSGSSFSMGTWGLGLVGPADAGDEDDLVSTISRVGCGMADPSLAQTLVHGVRPAIGWLEGLGVDLREPTGEQDAREAGFIPCFDDRPRLWRGIERESLAPAFESELERLGVIVLERFELMDLVEEDEATGAPVSGAWLYDHAGGRFVPVGCGAAVIASGGGAGLFGRRLAPGDVLGSVQGVALAHGCGLVNVEFLQLMPGLLSPVHGVVFNEKTFRYLDSSCFEGTGIPSAGKIDALLEMRSGHGPFTSRLPDREIDLAIAGAGADGLEMRYRRLASEAPEYVRIFSDWLEDAHGVSGSESFRLGLFAHASNGGIRIGSHGQTALPGLFAAGEAAGGMHGADRLGGLASASALVFGRASGSSAARWASARPGRASWSPAVGPDAMGRPSRPLARAEADGMSRRLAGILDARCMVARTEEGLGRALKETEGMERDLMVVGASSGAATADHDALARALRLRHQLLHARALITAMLERRESRGSHHRADHPGEDPALARPQEVALSGDAPQGLVVRALGHGAGL